MARSPNRQVVFDNGGQGTPIAEIRILTWPVRVWRFLRWILIPPIIAAVYGVGVMTGTNGQFADGVAELRRITNTPKGSNARMSDTFDALERLDATTGIDLVKTRHGVGRSLAALDTLCRDEIATIRQETARVVAIGLGALREDLAGLHDATTSQLSDVQETALATGELAAAAESDCKRAHELFGGILEPLLLETEQAGDTD